MTSQHNTDRISASVVGIAIAAFLVHICVNIISPYGVHRDEFLYIAMGEHLQLWKMDFPPFIAVAANISRAIAGDSLAAIRLLPAIGGSLLILLSADIARRLGGNVFAQIIAALAMLFPGIFMRPGNLFHPVVFDQLWWTLGLWCILRWRLSGDNRWWIGFGIVMGIGLFTKFSILFIGFGVFVGLLATNERRLLLTRWPWIALAITVLIGLPSIVGQIRLGYPVVAQMENLQANQLAYVSWLGFIAGQFLNLSFSMIVALTGIIALLTSKRYTQFRILGWIFVGAFGVLFILHGKAYYLGPVYPAMIGAGAVVIEAVGSGRLRTAFHAGITGVLLVGGLIVIPFGLPVLAPPVMERYGQAIGITSAVKTNQGHFLRLPQDYADMLGWEDRVEALASAYRNLTPEQRAHTIIIAGNYGEAGAIDFFGPRYGLPHALCVSGTYWFFGPGAKPGTNALTIGIDERSLKGNWRKVTFVSKLTNDWTVEEEQDISIYFCEGEIKTMQQLWPSFEGRN